MTVVAAGVGAVIVSAIETGDRISPSLRAGSRARLIIAMLTGLDLAAGATLATLAFELPVLSLARNTWVAWVAVGAGLPKLVRSDLFHWRVGSTPVGLSTIYLPLRERFERWLDTDVTLWRNELAEDQAKVAVSLAIKATRIEPNILQRIIDQRSLSLIEQQRRAGKVRGVVAGPLSNEQRLARLFALLHTWGMGRYVATLIAPPAHARSQAKRLNFLQRALLRLLGGFPR